MIIYSENDEDFMYGDFESLLDAMDDNNALHAGAVYFEADHIEQRLRTWRQQHMNLHGDHLALDDFMEDDTIADLVDYVCDASALDALLHAAPATGGAECLELTEADQETNLYD